MKKTPKINIFYLFHLVLIKNGPTPASFLFIFVLSDNNLQKIVDFSRIQTRIVGIEGKLTDLLTTISAVLSNTKSFC